MALDFASNISDLVLSLEGLSALTEKIYTGLGSTYPLLLGELQKGVKLSTEIFKANKEQSVTSNFNLMFEYIKQGNNDLRQLSKEDRTLHDRLQDRLGDIQSLEQHIQQIKDDSGSMELISLNAMTVALKAGNTGRAFSIITEELKRLSGRTMEITDRLTDRGRRVLGNFQVFQKDLERLEEHERTIIETFESDFSACVQNMDSSIRKVEELMLTSKDICDRITRHLTALITAVQSQDLIRQSIDHVIMSLKELDGTTGLSRDYQDQLDHLSFHEQLSALCISLLDDIRNMNEKSRDSFVHNLGLIRAETEMLQKHQAVIKSSTEDNSNKLAIRGAFLCSQDMFARFATGLSDLIRAKNQSVNGSQELERQVRELDDDFHSFESIITRFQTVDIASRIEIAKQLVLKEMSSTVDEMTSLTGHIKDDVDAAVAITGSFLKETHRQLSTYRSFNHQRAQLVQDFISGIGKRSKNFVTVQENLFDSFGKSGNTISGFIQSFGKTDKDISVLSGLSQEFNSLNDRLRIIQNDIRLKRQELEKANQIPSWQIRNRKLVDIIERFTILSHKKAAAEIGGFEVEEGHASGEVTLF